MNLAAPTVALLVVGCLRSGSADIGGYEATKISFTPATLPKTVTWTDAIPPPFKLTDSGLVFQKPRQGAYDVWIQTGKVPAGNAWRPPDSVGVELSVRGTAPEGFPLYAYVRYGCDGDHWSTWYKMAPLQEAAKGAVRTYSCGITLPVAARERYYKLMAEWRKTDPDWPSNEHEFCTWLARKHPKFFESEFPFIGYVQVRLERLSVEKPFTIQGLDIKSGWVIGGLHDPPREGVKADYDARWHFELPPRRTDTRASNPDNKSPASNAGQ